jgi:hypothetical protein
MVHNDAFEVWIELNFRMHKKGTVGRTNVGLPMEGVPDEMFLQADLEILPETCGTKCVPAVTEPGGRT